MKAIFWHTINSEEGTKPLSQHVLQESQNATLIPFTGIPRNTSQRCMVEAKITQKP